MRDESSPFLDHAFRGMAVGAVGAATTFATYYGQNPSTFTEWDGALQLATEVFSFVTVATALLAGGAGWLRGRIGLSRSLMLICALTGPFAVSFATWRFGSYPIPMVDEVVVATGLGVTFVGIVWAMSPGEIPRVLIRLVAFALPLGAIAWAVIESLRPWVNANYDALVAIGPAIIGAAGGAIIGPVCGLWLGLAFRPKSNDAATNDAALNDAALNDAAKNDAHMETQPVAGV